MSESRTLCVHHLARQGIVVIVKIIIIIIIIILVSAVCSVVWCTGGVLVYYAGAGEAEWRWLVLASAGPGPASPCQLPCGRHGCIAALLLTSPVLNIERS